MRLELIYRSVMSAGTDPRAVADVVRTARAHNQAHDITGVLVFDGENFVQLLEGPETAVRELMARIARDPRHHRVQICHEHPGRVPPRFPDWSMAFALDTEAWFAPVMRGLAGGELADEIQRRALSRDGLDLGSPQLA